MISSHIHSGSGRLQEAYDDLMRAWAETSEHWRDANSRAFEEQYLIPLGDELRAVLPAIGHLGGTLTKARRDCSE